MPNPIVREIAAPQMDTGAPRPEIAATDDTVTLSYTDISDARVKVTFLQPRAHYFGPPNDEALSGHPLASFGLTHYAAFEVANSRWIEELRDMNRVHPNHFDALYDDLRHFIWTFHDDTFECVAKSFSVA